MYLWYPQFTNFAAYCILGPIGPKMVVMETDDNDLELEVFWASGSPMAWPVQIALFEKGLPHQSTCVELGRGDTRTPRYLAMNPRGKVPVLRDGSDAVYESRAILEYLDDNYPQRSLTPVDKRQRMTDAIRKHETAYIYPAADAAISYTSYSSTLAKEQWDIAHLQDLATSLISEFSRWDRYLIDREWLAGGTSPTQADMLLIPQVLYMRRFGYDYEAVGQQNLARYVQQACDRESVVQTWPPHWLESEGDPTFTTATRGNAPLTSE